MPQRPVEIIGFRLKGADYLQLRVALRRTDRGICDLIVVEDATSVSVRAVACEHDHDPAPVRRGGLIVETDCPCNVWLDEPLGERVVIDIDSGEPLPLCIPGWGHGTKTVYVPRPAGVLWPKEPA